MATLTDIPGMTRDGAELLAAAGVSAPSVLAGLDAAEVHQRVELVAWQLGRRHRVPSVEQIAAWRSLAVEGKLLSVDDMPEALVARRQPVSPPPAAAPPARRAPAVNPAAVRQISAEPAPEAPAQPAPAAPEPAFIPVPRAGREDFSSTGKTFASFDEYETGQSGLQPLPRIRGEATPELEAMRPERVALAKAGKPLSRWVRRGVLHPHPGLLLFGALVSLLWRLALVSAIVGLGWFLIVVDDPSRYTREVLGVFGLLTVLGLLQLLVLTKARCRICSCPIFFSRRCMKNKKAHSLPPLGHTGSLSLHLLIFQWFRCMYCGTAVRLWPGKREE